MYLLSRGIITDLLGLEPARIDAKLITGAKYAFYVVRNAQGATGSIGQIFQEFVLSFPRKPNWNYL